MPHDSRAFALALARSLDEKGAEDLVVLAMPKDRTLLYDYVILANGRSDRMVFTLADEVHHYCKLHKIEHHPIEGQSGWLLVDCGDVVVHALLTEMRERYQLEGLWPGAERVEIGRA